MIRFTQTAYLGAEDEKPQHLARAIRDVIEDVEGLAKTLWPTLPRHVVAVDLRPQMPGIAEFPTSVYVEVAVEGPGE